MNHPARGLGRWRYPAPVQSSRQRLIRPRRGAVEEVVLRALGQGLGWVRRARPMRCILHGHGRCGRSLVSLLHPRCGLHPLVQVGRFPHRKLSRFCWTPLILRCVCHLSPSSTVPQASFQRTVCRPSVPPRPRFRLRLRLLDTHRHHCPPMFRGRAGLGCPTETL